MPQDELALPDQGPRKEYGARIEGPAVRDAEEIFWKRWEAAIDGDDLYAEYATRFDLDDAPAEPSSGVAVQVEATLPEAWADMSIRETHMLSDDAQNNLDVMALAADDSQEILDWWEDNAGDLSGDEAESKWSWYQPSGFVYPPQISSDHQFDVGPDLF